MKNIPGNIALIITEVAVKTYIFVGVVWSKGKEQYKPEAHLPSDSQTVSA